MRSLIKKYYDLYIIFFSGGKDCTAAFLYLLELGIPISKIELWHHDIDGEGSIFMDWEITKDYCRAFANTFGVPIYFSGKTGGFKGEMLRKDSLTASTYFEDINHNIVIVGGKRGKKNTRRKFPQVTASLKERWCSAYLKIDIGATGIRNQERFRGIKTLTISGERGEESKARSNYAILEADRSDCRQGKTNRYVDRHRPVRDWTEKEVWDIIQRWKIRVHPAYYLGWGRVSCKYCIFGNSNQMASAYYISPEQGDEIIYFEKDFGLTIKRNITLPDFIAKGEIYPNMEYEIIELATSFIYTEKIIMDNWYLPKGAYGESCGPT